MARAPAIAEARVLFFAFECKTIPLYGSLTHQLAVVSAAWTRCSPGAAAAGMSHGLLRFCMYRCSVLVLTPKAAAMSWMRITELTNSLHLWMRQLARGQPPNRAQSQHRHPAPSFRCFAPSSFVIYFLVIAAASRGQRRPFDPRAFGQKAKSRIKFFIFRRRFIHIGRARLCRCYTAAAIGCACGT